MAVSPQELQQVLFELDQEKVPHELYVEIMEKVADAIEGYPIAATAQVLGNLANQTAYDELLRREFDGINAVFADELQSAENAPAVSEKV